jgi:hypothetical protein
VNRSPESSSRAGNLTGDVALYTVEEHGNWDPRGHGVLSRISIPERVHMQTVHGSMRAVVLVTALTAGLAIAGGPVALSATVAQAAPRGDLAARPMTAPSAGAAAAGWLGRQFERNGDLPETEGETGVNYVPLAVVALASAKVGSHQISEAIAYLERNFASFVEVPVSKSKSVADPGRLAEVILAAVVAKANPRAFGGTKPVNNLVARLLATQARSGTDKGLFGSPEAPTDSTAFTQGLVLTALAAVRQVNDSGAAWLVAQQCHDGGWESYRSVSKPCPPPNPTTYTGPDTNDTALAVEGLVASKVSPKVSPLSFIKSSQYPGGGFAYYGGDASSQAPDPDSTAMVAQALVALGKLSAVTRRGRGAEAGLATFQLGCSSPVSQRGAYRYPGASGPNLYATIQAIPAVMREAYPIAPGSASRSLPVMSCK